MGLLVALVPLFLQGLPDDGEGEALEAVCNNAGSEASSEEADETVGVQDHLDGLRVGDWDLVGLLCGLDYAQAVAAAVGDDGGGEADSGVAAELLEGLVRIGFRDVFLEGVEGEKPGEAEGGCGGEVIGKGRLAAAEDKERGDAVKMN